MKRATFLTAFCAASTLLGLGAAQRMNKSSNRSSGPNMASAVDFQTFELDGQVHDLMWCGANDEIVLLQSSDGTVYRSRDRGSSWKKLSGVMNKSGYQVADDDQEVSRGAPFPADRSPRAQIGQVHRMIQNPVDDQLVVFVGKCSSDRVNLNRT